jgi:hypothetical protein
VLSPFPAVPSARRWRLALLVVVLAAGCGGPRLRPVEGKVVFPDGSALTVGTVVFIPKDKNASLSPRGEVRADGTFRMMTFKEGDGAPEGEYQVLIAPEAVLDPPPTPPFDRRFMSIEKSGLEYTVKPGKNEFFTITVEKPKGR